jgi:hypothetical protein
MKFGMPTRSRSVSGNFRDTDDIEHYPRAANGVGRLDGTLDAGAFVSVEPSQYS